MQLRTLGGLNLEGADFPRPKALLLAYLALEGPQERRHLAELFWPGTPYALRNLNTVLTRFRAAALGVVEGDGVRVWTTVDCDATTLLSALEGNEPESGLELYRGPFLEGLSLRAWGSELEEWVLQTREFIAGHVQQALLNLAEREASRGEFQQADKKAERTHLLAGAPALEPHDLQRLLTLLLAGGSLRAGEVRREALDFDLSLAASEAEARDHLRTLHREDDQHTSSNLPPQGNAFVGRELELTEITELLLHPHSPLLSLVGAGGVGKTRLALEVARELLAGGGFADGVVFVSLEALSDASSVLAAVAAVLGLDLSGQEDAGSMVKRFLSEKRLLLVLDNFEQVLEGAAFVRELLDACPQLTLLITSRERLNLDMESVFAIEGLAYPEPATPLERAGYFGAVQLFLQRARRAEHGFSLTPDTLPAVLRICQLVEGMPLALELAASWLRALPMDDIVRELEGSIDLLESPARDVRERRRSVRAVFDHSWALLQARERDVLRGLSVFRGGFRRQAAAEIAAATLPVLASLVDKSLLRMNPEGRYDRHPLLSQNTRARNSPSGPRP